MNIRPVRTEADHRRALREIEKLWGAKKGTSRGDRLDVLVTLVEDYERRHHPIGPPDPIEAIRFRMDQEGWSRADLARLLGGRNRVSEVFSRRRALSVGMIRKLHEGLGIPADVLIQPVR